MDLVVDANILFASLIRNNQTAELFLEDSIRLFAPAFLMEEYRKYQDLILEKTSRNQEDITRFFWILERKINFVPISRYKTEIEDLRKVCPDPKDLVYLALALHLGIPVWTNDARLQSQEEVSIVTTRELLDLIQTRM